MHDLPATSEKGLVRALGVRAMAANTVNSIVGAGIFGLPAAVAAVLGPSAIVAYVVCAVAVGLIALSLAEAGSRISSSGGLYAYVETAFGPFPGFLVGVLFWFGCQAAASAAVASILMGAVAQVLPLAGDLLPRGLLLVVLYAMLAAVNVRGVRTGARLVELVTLAKLTPLVILAVAGLWASTRANLAWSGMPSVGDVGGASLVLIFAFTGAESALTPGGEVRNPARTIPRALLIGMVATALLYVSVQMAAQGVLGADLARNPAAPLAVAAGRIFGPAGVALMVVGAAVSTFGWLSGDMLATPRLLFAFGRDGFLPARVARIHPRFHTPATAIAVHSAVCCTLALTGTFRTLAVVSVVAVLFIYLACCVSIFELRRRGVGAEANPFRTPGGPLVPLLACGVCVWLLASATAREFAAVGAMLLAAAVLYGVRAWRQRGGLPQAVNPFPGPRQAVAPIAPAAPLDPSPLTKPGAPPVP